MSRWVVAGTFRDDDGPPTGGCSRAPTTHAQRTDVPVRHTTRPRHPRARVGALATALSVAALTTATLATPGATAVPAPPSTSAPSRGSSPGPLTVSPTVFVAGQAITFRGALPRPGRRAIHLQFHMNRPGDRWTDVKKSTRRTTAAGRFKFRFPAPAMFNISYRVVGGGMVTRAHLFYAKPQAVTLSVNGADERASSVTVLPLLPFTVLVDSAADIYPDRKLEPPVLLGRSIDLQERVNGDQWQTIATSPALADGRALFGLPASLSGERVLRARVANYTVNGDRIGWTASWPTYIQVLDVMPRTLPLLTSGAAGAELVSSSIPRTDSTGATDASAQYGWYNPVYDFAWEYGQSLSSPPTRGAVLKGSWLEASSGSGRVVTFNGALAFQSRLLHKGPGDRGSTYAVLSGNAQKHGRWEFRSWHNVFEQDGKDFRFRVELVPQGTAPGACAPETIRVADVELGASSYTVGVRSAQADAQWSYTKTGTPVAVGLHNFAVEVAPGHISWFFDGKAFATVKSKAALAGKTWVPRLSMVGAKDATEHNGSQVSVDWVRSWTLATGKQATNGATLTKTALSPTC